MAGLITVAWAVSFTFDLVNQAYDPPAYIGPLMMIVAGAIFGEGVVRAAVRRNGRNGNGGR
jgi:hypothetical protein